MIKIKDIEELKREANYDNCQTDIFEGCISLAGGLARSSKRIRYFADTDCWEVYHGIDETEELFNSTLLGVIILPLKSTNSIFSTLELFFRIFGLRPVWLGF